MSSELHPILNELVPVIYDVTREQLQLPQATNMAASNQCNNLTLNLYQALDGRNIPARRESHFVPGREPLWHYVINHSVETLPSEEDLITDLNPWQFDGKHGHRSFLHAERGEVKEILRQEGAPEWFISLRGLATIKDVHTEKLTPFVR
jgi:hypothetical protein